MKEGEYEIIPTKSEEYYIRDVNAIQDIIRNIYEGHYCTVLGPPYCQKSLVLDDIHSQLIKRGDLECISIDLREIDFTTDEEFLQSFAVILSDRLTAQTSIQPPFPSQKIVDERVLQNFIQEYVLNLRKDLVLLLDHLEKVRHGPLRSLLIVLRAVYSERQPDDRNRLCVVTASSLSLAELTLGPSSPFNIAHLTLIQDLPAAASKNLVEYLSAEKNIKSPPESQERFILATGGDRYLIPKLCHYCFYIARTEQHDLITSQNVEEAINWFIKDEAGQYLPLRETIRTIESQPDNLMNVIKIIDRGYVPRRNLYLELESEIDKLRLTGAVKVDLVGNEQVYSIRNEIYHTYLRCYFHPERVVHILTLSGRWGEALSYLEQLITNNPRQHRKLLLDTIVNAVFAAKNIEQTIEPLARYITEAFNIPGVSIYLINPERSKLNLTSSAGFSSQAIEQQYLNLEQKSPLAKVLQSHDPIVIRNPAGQEVLMAPMRRDDEESLGVATFLDFEADQQEDAYLELLTFLKQVSRAIAYLIERENRVLQLTKLNEIGLQVTSSLNLRQTLQATVEAAIAAVPAAQKGSLFEWDENCQRLVIRAQKGFRDDIYEVLELQKGEGYAGWVYEKQTPLRLDVVYDDPRTKRVEHPEILAEKSAICVPLKAWGRVIGVLCLDSLTSYHAFQDSDLNLLATFGTQAAIAIQNARLYTELYNLGMQINQGNLSPREIFRQTAESITHISDARAANLLLLRDADYPKLSVSQPPLLSACFGLSEDFEQHIKARPGGLTYQVLVHKKPMFVASPKHQPGINPRVIDQGIQAYLCLPLTIRDRVIGVLFVHYDKPHEFSENEIEMLSLFANQAALAIENAQQQEELTMTKAVAWMGIVFTSMAHRITQKTSAIQNTVWGLRKLAKDQPEIIERLGRIEETAKIIADIPGRALLPYHDESVTLDINKLLEKEVPRWIKTSDKIHLQLPPTEDHELRVSADPKWIAIVVELLTTNAVKALSGQSAKELIVRTQIRGERIVVEFQNNGKQIPEAIQVKLFKEPIPKEGVEGSGVGLLIARTIMRRYHGDIELLRSIPGDTTFSLWLPGHPSNGE